jgi:hypothetical protein
LGVPPAQVQLFFEVVKYELLQCCFQF